VGLVDYTGMRVGGCYCLGRGPGELFGCKAVARASLFSISSICSRVMFDFNKYSLKPSAREKIAKVSGILLAYPGLKVQVEGYTDPTGNDEYNIKLSQQRADAIRDHLVAQGVPAASVTAIGYGKANPVASNDTADGRQENRRVELVVSGDWIGHEK